MLDLLLSGTTLIAFTLISFFLLELLFPARVYDQGLKKSAYITNGLVFIFNTIIMFSLSVAAVWLLVQAFAHGYLDFFWDINLILTFVVGFLILEIAIWYWHRLNHVMPFLWKFHQAHHSELYLNSTSALRFHIGELLLSVLFKAVLLLVLSIPLWIFFIHETAITLFAIAHHANIQLPEKLSLLVSKVFITPRMHYAHHSTIRSEHNSNYGVMFSWWDHIFKTVNRKEPTKIGLSYTEEFRFMNFLLMPSKKFLPKYKS